MPNYTFVGGTMDGQTIVTVASSHMNTTQTEGGWLKETYVVDVDSFPATMSLNSVTEYFTPEDVSPQPSPAKVEIFLADYKEGMGELIGNLLSEKAIGELKVSSTRVAVY